MKVGFILFFGLVLFSTGYSQTSGVSGFSYYKIGESNAGSVSATTEFQNFSINAAGSTEITRGENTEAIKKQIILPKRATEPLKTNEKRMALVIGNSSYQHASKLKNPVNDAQDMKAALQSIGFEVTLVLNANYEEMKQALMSFEDKIYDADIVLCFYAGHGIQVEGSNYLIPIDAKLDKKEHIKYETIEVEMISKIMELSTNTNRLNMIILDACRNNPFRSWSRGGDAGLSKIDPPNGTLIAYATSPNSVASDGDGENGLYTGELIKQLLVPQRIEDVFIYTRVAVEEKSSFQQTPWEQAKLRGAYYLVPDN